MDEPWAKVADVGPEDMPGDLWEACADECEALWGDLSIARREAYNQNQRWSVHCDWLTERIVILSRMAGITDWDHVPVDLVLDGTYEGILRTAVLDPGELPTPEQRSALAAMGAPSSFKGGPE
jgi:hypothetical protein